MPPPLRAVLPLAVTLLLAAAIGCSAAGSAEPRSQEPAPLPLPGPSRSESASAGPATTSPAAPTPAEPLAGTTVVIDPGHNGANHTAPERINEQIDAGGFEKNCDTVGAQSGDGYPEHEFNFTLSTLLRERLTELGAQALLTRPDNEGVGPCLPERAGLANERDADAALSIHADGGPPQGRGFHIIAPGDPPNPEITEPSLQLGADLRDHFQEATGQPVADYIATEEGIDRRDDLAGLNLSEVPKVFLEAGNLRNDEDAALLADPEWQEQAADGIAAGLRAFLER